MEEGGADVNRRDAHGRTALFFVNETNRVNMVHLLLNADADPMIMDEGNITMLEHAEARWGKQHKLCDLYRRHAQRLAREKRSEKGEL